MTNENKTIPYSTLHTWIRKILDRTKCEQCGLIGKKTRGGKWNIHCANKSGKYELNIKDWLALCTVCHKNYDIKSKKIKKYIHVSIKSRKMERPNMPINTDKIIRKASSRTGRSVWWIKEEMIKIISKMK